MFETETESELFQESDYVDSHIYDNEEDKQITSPSFIIYWTCLIVFTKKMFTFYLPDAGYYNKPPFRKISIDREWKFQSNCNHYSVGNLTSAASVLLSANIYQRRARLSRNPLDIQNKFLRDPKPLFLYTETETILKSLKLY